MKKIVLVLLIIISFTKIAAQNKNLLSGKYSKYDLAGILIPLDRWTPFPKITDRSSWAKADEPMMKAYVIQAETYLPYSWPSIPAK